MATRPDVKTKKLTRNKIAEISRDHETVKFLENLGQDVSETLPDAAFGNQEAIEQAQADATAALLAAAVAQGTANNALTAANNAQADATTAISDAAAAQATATSAQVSAAAANAAAAAAQADADALEAVPYITLSPSGTTTNERALAVDPLDFFLTDGGAGNNLTLSSRDSKAVLPADVSDATGVFVDATGLLLPVVGNAIYLVEGLITFQAAATTTGIALGFTLPAGASISGAYQHNISATAIEGSYNITSGAVKGNTSGVLVANENVPITGRWIIQTGATVGSAQLQFRSEVAASNVTLKANLSALTSRRLA